jgi:hypothetical protein
MDPNETLRDFLDACEAGNRKVAEVALSDLAEWIAKGGFLPIVVRSWKHEDLYGNETVFAVRD